MLCTLNGAFNLTVVMWPLDLPASQVLKLPGETPILWAVFDPDWYLCRYPQAGNIVGVCDPASVLKYYLEVGQNLGHSPNRLFDEQWHRGALSQHCGATKQGALALRPSTLIVGVAHWIALHIGCSTKSPIATDIPI